jgi:hypothetical protein
LAASTVAFASDGARYVAWQTRVGAPVVVLDTRTGAQRRLGLPDGCELANEEQRQSGHDAAAGQFLLDCVIAGKRESSQKGTPPTRPKPCGGEEWVEWVKGSPPAKPKPCGGAQ